MEEPDYITICKRHAEAIERRLKASGITEEEYVKELEEQDRKSNKRETKKERKVENVENEWWKD